MPSDDRQLRDASDPGYECRMLPILDRPDRRGLVANVAAAVIIVGILNGLIFGLGWQANSQDAPGFLPPPIVIGLVWCALFPCMALARWELNRVNGTRLDKSWMIVLFLACAFYPFYTAGLNNDLIGEVANISIEVIAVGLAARYIGRAPRATAWLVPLCLWLGFASVAGGFTLARSIG